MRNRTPKKKERELERMTKPLQGEGASLDPTFLIKSSNGCKGAAVAFAAYTL